MAKLYEIAERYKNLAILLEDETIDNEMIMPALEAIEGEISDKAVGIVGFIKSMDYDIDAIKAEEKRLADRRKAIENRKEGIKQYIKSQMEFAGLDKIKSPTFTIALQNNPPALEISDENAIPAEFTVIIPERKEPNKQAIKDALKAGSEVPGCRLTNGKSLRIR